MTHRLDPALSRLAEAAGLLVTWKDAFGAAQEVDADILRDMLARLGLAGDNAVQMQESLALLQDEAEQEGVALVIADVGRTPVFSHAGPLSYELNLEGGGQVRGVATPAGPGLAAIAPISRPGYHHLHIGQRVVTLAVAPGRCPSIGDCTGSDGDRYWGVAAQVYSLRRGDTASDFHAADALGDYTLVGALAAAAARQGASALAISPVHAMFSAAPQRYSPYSPSSRLFFNAAYIDPAAVLGHEAMMAATRLGAGLDLAQAAPSDYIDWQRATPLRLKLLRHMYGKFCRNGPQALLTQYRAFRHEAGEALESHARYEALHALYTEKLGPEHGWADWPAILHDPRGAGVEDYAATHGDAVGFHVFLQWLAQEGLKSAQAMARAAGMPVGLIGDLAIGTDPRGSHAWSRQKEILANVSVGAPPDLYQAQGQNWGLTAFSPRALRAHGYRAFIETLRASLAHVGGLRIDHILGLARMWVIAQGAQATQGVYLRYPLDDMLRLVALEAWRHRALIIGENLGTVPAGFNDCLREKGIMGMNVLWFEQQGDLSAGPTLSYVAPGDWPSWSMATTTTHDLPTLAGWWEGRDLAWRRDLDQAGDAQAQKQATMHRQLEKRALWRALQDAGCVRAGPADLPDAPPRESMLAFVAGTPGPLCIVPVEDLLGLREQPNLPGAPPASGEGHPNWVQRLPVPVDEIFDDAAVRDSVAAIANARSAA